MTETNQVYALWVNEERTVLVTYYQMGEMTVATRETSEHTWGPPVYLVEEKIDDEA